MSTTPGRSRLYFFWDYDIGEEEVRQILRGGDEAKKIWVISRLLEAARWEDIWKYVRLRDVREWFPKLHLRAETRSVWAYALDLWGK